MQALQPRTIRIPNLTHAEGVARLAALNPLNPIVELCLPGYQQSGNILTAERQIMLCGYADRIAVGVYDKDGELQERFNILRK